VPGAKIASERLPWQILENVSREPAKPNRALNGGNLLVTNNSNTSNTNECADVNANFAQPRLWGTRAAPSTTWDSALEGDLIGALERQDLTCIGRRRDLQSQTFDNLAGAMHLTGVAGGQLTWSDP
jgi:hypothetical protein